MNLRIPEDTKKKWAEMGLYFGYPDCCIKDFCERGYKTTKEQQAVHNNYGFVPCPKCSQKILNGKETLESLIKNRICKTPFPQAS
jgi:hypothetical protein